MKNVKVTSINSTRLRAVPARNMPLEIGVIHFIGIGGIGMSGIAEILHNLGYKVAGSDIAEGYNIERLQKMGIKIAIGHKAENVSNVAVVVRSSAVPMTNPEIIAARENHIPVVKRSEMLAEICGLKATISVAGTHGKTTTTSLIARILESAEMDPTVINGGIINSLGTNAHLGRGEWLVAEADESDGTFIKIPSVIGIVTNIDPEHFDYWGDFEKLKNGFRAFVENLPFYGLAIMCYDHLVVRSLVDSITDRRVITYGINSNDADIKAINIRTKGIGSLYDVEISRKVTGEEKNRIIKDIYINIPGKHNVQNSLAAIAVGLELRIGNEAILSALKNFAGVKRRFTKTGEVNGVTIIDDYAHHPKEIEATLKAARDVQGKGSIIAVFQPHRYSRVESLFADFGKCFCDADKVIVSEIYSAGEKPVKDVNRDALVALLKQNKVDAYPLELPDKLAGMVKSLVKSGDMVICLGAGDITKWAYDLPKQLEEK